ncbi:MAG: NAD(+)/NADH kinase [Flavobacteriales bacterium]|nr:NAD(+)/NADH kinase [Flavobacteriales bacterium]MCX7651117.1 NAD(+)/NADH kinase [Flavobacteriales bacterium]MDW8431405.1 NAD(+)/NADH kinase [Flavobacteriales bacterium]
MRFALYGRTIDSRNREGVQKIINTLSNQRSELVFHNSYRVLCDNSGLSLPSHLQTFNHLKELAPLPDFFFSLGGDGTLLSALPLIYPTQVPVVAINVGRLGYLSTAEVSGLEKVLHALKEGLFVAEERSLVQALVGGKPLDDFGLGLNEFTVVKTDTSSMIHVETYIDDFFFSNIWADGLVVATPTGSTAYALSCGGPVITPSSPVLVMAAIAPHNLNVRPIVLADNTRLRFVVQSRSTRIISSLDSRFVYLPVGSEIEVLLSAWRLRLVRLSPHDHLETLRTKLLWGNDMRNALKFN